MLTFSSLASLKGKSCLITGAAGHLGRAISHAIAEAKANLVLVDRDDASLKKLASELTARWRVRVSQHVCDLEVQSQRSSLMQSVKLQSPDLGVLINNAAFVGTTGLTGWAVPFEQQTIETWRRAMEVNLTAAFDLCQGLAPELRRNKGSVINIASIYGVSGPDWRLYEGTALGNPAAYAASKGGLAQLTRWLATTLAPDIRVNTISPGGIARGQPEAFVKEYESRTPMKRMMSEEDVIGAVVYLATPLSAYVTGQNLLIDGGWSAW